MTPYLNSVLGSFWHWLYFFVTMLPGRLWKLILHVFIVPFTAFTRNSYNRRELSAAKRFLSKSLWWIAVLFSKIIDITGLWEIVELGFSLVKVKTRRLTDFETEEAKKVFGDALPYSAIRIDENSVFAKIGAQSTGKSNLGLVTFRTVNFTRKIECKNDSLDMAWLIHELVHVAQMQSLGSQYLFEALYAQKTSGYSYGGEKTLQLGLNYENFNLEQQADIAKNYYKTLQRNRDITFYQPYIDALRQGQF